MRRHMNIQAQMTGKRKGRRLRGLGHAVGSMSRKTLSLCRLESDMPEEVPQTDGGAWTLGEEGGIGGVEVKRRAYALGVENS